MSDPVATLCERARAGDMEAASALVSLFYERVFAWLRRLTGNEEDAADLTQKTFSKAWQALGSYQGRSSFSTWLHGIGHHVYVDWRRRQVPHEQPQDEWWLAASVETPSPCDAVADAEQAQRIFLLVEQLDEDTRETVHLHYYQGLSLAETAEVLGIATSTVKYRLREAIEQLRSKAAEPKIGSR